MPKKRTKYPLIAFALFLIFNPNISVIDILPDFIGYFILAKVFLDASYRAPFFAEARDAFIKLAWLNLAKIPALLLITAARASNTFGNDMISIASFVFAVAESILMVIAIKNIYDALFRLGERTEADALISPFHISKKRTVSTESLRMLSYAFAIVKCAAYGLPDMLLLTTMKETSLGTQIITISPMYPITLIFSILVASVIGTVWRSRTKKYVRTVIASDCFTASLNELAQNAPLQKVKNQELIRRLGIILSVISVGFFLFFDVRFDNINGANLIPHTFFAIMLFISALLARKHLKRTEFILSLSSSSAYSIASAAEYYFEYKFLSEYGYSAFISGRDSLINAAKEAYVPVRITAFIELLTFLFVIVALTLLLRRTVLSHTGISVSSEHYGKLEKEFHNSMMKKIYIASALMTVCGILRLLHVISSGNVQMVFTDITDVTRPVIAAPSVEWLGIAVTAASIIMIFYSVYLIFSIKEEIKNKYEMQ